MHTVDSTASMSILEEATVFAERPMMGAFNNLVMYDQHVKQNSLQVPVSRRTRVKTPALRLRVENLSRFRQSEK